LTASAKPTAGGDDHGSNGRGHSVSEKAARFGSGFSALMQEEKGFPPKLDNAAAQHLRTDTISG
jgi:hypothetical protein